MADIDIEYYFSKMTLFFVTIILGVLAIVISFFVFAAFQENVLLSIVLAIPLLVILFAALPNYIRFIRYSITNIPAVILTKEKLVDNINRNEYKWTDIKEITLRANSGKAFGSYTAITLKDSAKVIQIPQNSIKCKKMAFLNDLIKYHKMYSTGA